MIWATHVWEIEASPAFSWTYHRTWHRTWTWTGESIAAPHRHVIARGPHSLWRKLEFSCSPLFRVRRISSLLTARDATRRLFYFSRSRGRDRAKDARQGDFESRALRPRSSDRESTAGYHVVRDARKAYRDTCPACGPADSRARKTRGEWRVFRYVPNRGEPLAQALRKRVILPCATLAVPFSSFACIQDNRKNKQCEIVKRHDGKINPLSLRTDSFKSVRNEFVLVKQSPLQLFAILRIWL